MSKEYTKKLEGVIRQMLQPLKDVPFNMVIKSIAGFDIIPFNDKSDKDSKLRDVLSQAARKAAQKVNKKGIKRPRPNEVGNDIEVFVKAELNKLKYKANSPMSRSGKKKSTGYPDIEFVDEFKRLNYLECKSYSKKNEATTFRSFYLSPSDDFKVTKNAHHFLLAYEVYVSKKVKGNNVYKCRAWKLLSLERLDVDVKYEFNTSNIKLYRDELVIAEGLIN